MADTSANALPTGYELGDYAVESVLGLGGFGITYLASDRQLGTRVAIKEYFPGSLAMRSEDWVVHCRADIDENAQQTFKWGLQQFLKEARALGQFKHQNIVRVLRFLEANGTAYMVMEYESGQSLTRKLAMGGNRLDEASLMRIFIPILNGLQAVHVAGLLHRDIKPDNIYLRTDGSPMLIDFGSVQPAAQTGSGTQPIALTPAYAAVEQYPGQGQEGPWTDIYSIGASMYRCITGVQPIGGFERYDAIRTYKPDPVALLAQSRPEGYSEYVLNCVDWATQVFAKNRPQSARDLQDALMGKRKSGAAAQRIPATPAPVAAPEEFVAERPTSVDHWKMVRWGMAGLLVILTLAISINYFTGNNEKLVATKNSGDAVATPTVLPGIESGSFTAVRRLTGSLAAVEAVAFIPGSDQLVSASKGGELVVWDINSGAVAATLSRHRHTVSSLVALGSGSRIAAGDDGGNIFIWEPTKKRVAERLTGHQGAIGAMAFAQGQGWLLSGGRDGDIMQWKLGGAGKSRVLASNLGRIDALAISPDGKLVAAGTVSGDVHVIDSKSGKLRWKLDDVGGLVKAVAFSPDGRWLVAGGLSDGISVWSAATGSVIRKMQQDRPSTVNALHFSRDGRWLFAGDAGGIVTVWETSQGRIVNAGFKHERYVNDLALSADGKTLASASADNSVILWAIN